MAADLFADFTATTLAGGAGGVGTALGASDTTLWLPAGVGSRYPSPSGGQSFMTLLGTNASAATGELVKCTARTGDQLTIVRNQGGLNQSWPVGTPVQADLSAVNLSNIWALLLAMPWSNLTGKPFYNVRDFGAVGDGVTDDRVAFQAALDYVRTHGGGDLYVPAGTYLCSAAQHPVQPAPYYACLVIGSNTHLRGAGAGSTIIKMANNSPDQAVVLVNYNTTSTGPSYLDNHIQVSNLRIDGNAAGQNTAVTDRCEGLTMIEVRRFRILNVVVQDVYGTTGGGNGPNGTQGEGFHFESKWSTDGVWENCIALSTGASTNTATGFSADGSTHVTWANCTATGMHYGMGFTNYHTTESMYTGCHAYGGGSDGFHCEEAKHISYVGCTSGGIAEDLNAPAGLNQSQTLGNAGVGFQVYGSTNASLSGCHSSYNGQDGLYVALSNPVAVSASHFNNNTRYGVNVNDTSSIVNVASDCFIANNTSGDVNTPSGVTNRQGQLSNQPAVPLTTHSVNNPYPFPVMVYIAGGSGVTVTVNTVGTGLSAGTFRVNPNESIGLVYSSAPSWQWFGG